MIMFPLNNVRTLKRLVTSRLRFQNAISVISSQNILGLSPVQVMDNHADRPRAIWANQRRNYDIFLPTRTTSFDEFKFLRRPLLKGRRNGFLSSSHQRSKRGGVMKKIPVGENVIEDLQIMFGMTRDEALNFTSSPKLFLVPDAILRETLCCLKDFKVPASFLLRFPWIFLQSADELAIKMRTLQEPYLFNNHIEGLWFCHFPLYQIRQYQQFFESEKGNLPDHNNRIYFLAEYFRVPVDLLGEKILNAHRVLLVEFHRIEILMELFCKYSIDPEEVFNNLRVFLCNVDVAKRRLEIITDAGLEKPKPWLLKSSEKSFDRYLSAYKAEKAALGECNSLEEFLAKRLKCTHEELHSYGNLNETVQNMSVAKADKMINLLLSEGFTENQILTYLSLLTYPVNRTVDRIQQLKEIGLKKFPLAIIGKSNSAFDIYLKNLKAKYSKC